MPGVSSYMKDMDFKFEIDRVKSPFTKADLINSLKEYARVHNVDSFGMRDYDSWDKRIASSETIRVRLESWGKALQLAGCRVVRGHKLDIKAMVEAFRECWRENGSVPTLRKLDAFLEHHNSPFRTKSYAKVFGGLGPLAKRIVAVQNGTLSENELYQPRRVAPPRDRAVPLRIRHAVLKRDGYRCVNCGADPSRDKTVRLEVDHALAVSRGGASTVDNLQTLCWACNQGKKDKDN